MVYYLVLFAYMVLVQYVNQNVKGKEGWRMVLTFLPLFLYGALRVNCGDYEIYENYNNLVRTSSGQIYDVIERMEPGYAYLNKLLPYRWIIILTSLLTCFVYGFLFVKFVPQQYRWFSILLFFLVGDKTFYFMFSGIRNSIVVSIFILYLVYRVNNRFKTKLFIIKEFVFLLIITKIASLFHASATIFFPIGFLVTLNKRITDIEIYLWIAVLIILWVLPVEQIINNFTIFQEDYFERYDYYLNRKEVNDAGFLAKFGATIFAVLCLINIRQSNDSEKKSIISRLMLLYIYSYMLGSLNIRISYFFVPFAIVYLTLVFAQWQKSSWTIAFLSFAIVFMFYSSFIAGTFGSAIYSPFINYRIALFP